MRDEELTYTSAAGRREGTIIVKLTGPLTLSTLFPLQDELRTVKPQVLILDLSDSTYMDSAGLGLIMNYYVSAQKNGRQVFLAGVNERISALLQLTKVHRILGVFPTAAEAEATL
jgi:anti-sigma B factor antagonist